MRSTEKELEVVLKALANKRRLSILRFLQKDQYAPVGEIADAIHLSFKSTSRHLAVLLLSDLVEREQKGLQVLYKLSMPLHPLVRTALTIL